MWTSSSPSACVTSILGPDVISVICAVHLIGSNSLATRDYMLKMGPRTGNIVADLFGTTFHAGTSSYTWLPLLFHFIVREEPEQPRMLCRNNLTAVYDNVSFLFINRLSWGKYFTKMDLPCRGISSS
ncbi:hypothetical protein PISMIDRAFT_527468 [Pisolithus microcarpus 441]|uniref:Uncharacterized protein n=1 Tax=Pisolithus microcarpus 441 TaxID=765257 RepID=A0A0C9ZHL6_9AGAM|nr:hypothetical protein BKA83DRAFT_527468 [Pisolithus microcarpus]KIK21962.1 hypothetical protein PISMIDRAFT_527468 [Pisolithus microcarpus 441]